MDNAPVTCTHCGDVITFSVDQAVGLHYGCLKTLYNTASSMYWSSEYRRRMSNKKRNKILTDYAHYERLCEQHNTLYREWARGEANA